MKAAIITLLFLAASAFAARLHCIAFYEGTNVLSGATSREGKLCGSISDEHGDAVIDHIGEWSGGRYKATWSEGGRVRIPKTLQVENVEKAANKEAATEEIKDMQHVVRSHT